MGRGELAPGPPGDDSRAGAGFLGAKAAADVHAMTPRRASGVGHLAFGRAVLRLLIPAILIAVSLDAMTGRAHGRTHQLPHSVKTLAMVNSPRRS